MKTKNLHKELKNLTRQITELEMYSLEMQLELDNRKDELDKHRKELEKRDNEFTEKILELDAVGKLVDHKEELMRQLDILTEETDKHIGESKIYIKQAEELKKVNSKQVRVLKAYNKLISNLLKQ